MTPDLVSFFLKGKMIVHEINQKFKIFNVRFFNKIYYKNQNPIFGELPKYIMQYLVMAWDKKRFLHYFKTSLRS